MEQPEIEQMESMEMEYDFIDERTKISYAGMGKRIKDEFTKRLVTELTDKNPLEWESQIDKSSSNRYISLLHLMAPNEEVFDNLRCVAERINLLPTGYLQECMQAYVSVRKSVVDSIFSGLGIDNKLSRLDFQRLEWYVIEAKLRSWIKAAKVFVGITIFTEKCLSWRIFGNLEGSSAEPEVTCFMEIVNLPINHLLNFAEMISTSRRSPEKLFLILEVYDVLVLLLEVFSGGDFVLQSNNLEAQASEILLGLVEAARGSLSAFENTLRLDGSGLPFSVSGNKVHQLTKYVMNYICLISDYKKTLTELVVSKPSVSEEEMELYKGENGEDLSPFTFHLIWIIVNLELNLERMSRLFLNYSTARIFLINNSYYIVEKITESPKLEEIVSSSSKLNGEFAMTQGREIWSNVLYCLRDEGLYERGSFSQVDKEILKERLMEFNWRFEDACLRQARLYFPDFQLREEYLIDIAEKLIMCYRSFVGRFYYVIGKYIKYPPDDLVMIVLNVYTT